jgi:hypothetical protein
MGVEPIPLRLPSPTRAPPNAAELTRCWLIGRRWYSCGCGNLYKYRWQEGGWRDVGMKAAGSIGHRQSIRERPTPNMRGMSQNYDGTCRHPVLPTVCHMSFFYAGCENLRSYGVNALLTPETPGLTDRGATDIPGHFLIVGTIHVRK